MTTICANSTGLELTAIVRQALIQRTGTPPRSAWMRRVMRDLDDMQYHVCDQWSSLDADDKDFFRRLVAGAIKPPAGLQAFCWAASTVFNVTFHRREAVEYFTAVSRLFDAITERVGSEVWGEALANPERVEKAKRGYEDFKAGRFSAFA